MSDVVERAKAALEGVSRGPWKLGNRTYPDVVHSPNGCLWNPDRGEINHQADGEFVAAARSLVPELVAEVERLRDLRPQLEAFARDCDIHGDMTPGAVRVLNVIAAAISQPTKGEQP